MSDGITEAFKGVKFNNNKKQNMNKLIYISAPWCGPCKMFGPVMSEVANSGIPVEKVDADKDQSSIIQYGVRSIPTVIKVDNSGNEIGRFVGAKSKQEVINFYNN